MSTAKRRFRLAGSIMLASMATLGCESPDLVMAPNTASQDPLPAAAYPQIVLFDGLERALVKEKPTVQPADETTPLRVSVPLRSVIDQGVTVEFKLVFRDAVGNDTNRNPVWRTITFPARGREFIRANAVSLDAVEWELQVRRKF